MNVETLNRYYQLRKTVEAAETEQAALDAAFSWVSSSPTIAAVHKARLVRGVESLAESHRAEVLAAREEVAALEAGLGV